MAASLRDRITALYDAFLSEDGREVDYAGMRGSPEFAAYVEATAGGPVQVEESRAPTAPESDRFY